MKKILYDKAAKVCDDIQLADDARRALTGDVGPAEFLNGLLERQLYPDAIRFLARALPRREATWWACICARGDKEGSADPAFQRALETAEQWVYKPTEENRRAAYAAAQATDFNRPAAWAAMAAFWSEGSLAPEDAPPVPPADNLTSKAVAGAVMLAAVIAEPERGPDKYRFFIEQGINIANGGNGRVWQD